MKNYYAQIDNAKTVEELQKVYRKFLVDMEVVHERFVELYAYYNKAKAEIIRRKYEG